VIINDPSSALDPDTFVSNQFVHNVRLPAAVAAERKLMLAILEDAIECFQHNILARSPKGRLEFEEARQWIVSTDTEWIFSYENICSTLGIDAAYVRDALLALHRGCQRGPQRERPAPRIVPLTCRRSNEQYQIAS